MEGERSMNQNEIAARIIREVSKAIIGKHECIRTICVRSCPVAMC